MKPRYRAIILIVFAFFITRSLFFILEKDLYLQKFPYQDDAPAYLKISQIFLGQGSYEEFELSPYVRVPGYPLLLAATEKIAGLNNFSAIFLVQQGLSLTITILLFTALYKKTTPKMSLGLTLSFIFFFDFALYSFLIRSEILFTFLIFLGALAHLKLIHHRQAKWAVLVGLLFGLATLTRPVAFLAFLPLSLTLLISKQKSSSNATSPPKLVFIYLITLVLVLTPWLARNYSLSHRFILQQDLSNIYYATLPGGHWQSVQISDVIDTTGKDYLSIDTEVTALAINNIKKDPNIWIKNSLHNFFYRLWSMGFTDTYLRYFEYTPDTGGYHKDLSVSPITKLFDSINIFSSRYSINPIYHLYFVANNILGFFLILVSISSLILFPYFKRDAAVLFLIFLYFWSITSVFAFSGSRYMIPMVPIIFLLIPDLLSSARLLLTNKVKTAPLPTPQEKSFSELTS